MAAAIFGAYMAIPELSISGLWPGEAEELMDHAAQLLKGGLK